MLTITGVASKYLAGLSVRHAAAEINKFLPKDRGYSQQAIATWLSGKRQPDFFVMYYLSTHAQGWVYKFAVEMITALGGGFYTEDIIPDGISIEQIDAMRADYARGMVIISIAQKYGVSVPTARIIVTDLGLTVME